MEKENNYFNILPEELLIIISSYLDNEYFITNLYELMNIDIKKLFMYKYKELYKCIRENHDIIISVIINYFDLYKDMNRLNYVTITKILEKNEMLRLYVGYWPYIISGPTINIIYTCLLSKLPLKITCSENINITYKDIMIKMNKIFKNDYASMYLYLNTSNIGSFINDLETLKSVMTIMFIYYHFDKDMYKNILPVFGLLLKDSRTIDTISKESLHDNYYQQLYDHLKNLK